MSLPRPDSGEYFGCDPPSVRRACLNCKKPECNNCMDRYAKERLYQRKNEKEKKKC